MGRARSALEGLDRRPSILRSSVCETVPDVVRVVGAPPVLEDASEQADEPVKIPAPLASAMKRNMGMLVER